MRCKPAQSQGQSSPGTLSLRGTFRAFVWLVSMGAIAGSLAGFLGGLWWFFDLTSHFRVQYAVVSLALGAAFFWQRRCRTSFAFAALGLVNTAVVAHALWDFSPARSASPGPTFRAILLNVHTANKRFDLVKQFLQQARPDFVVLEEVNESWMNALDDLRPLFPHRLEEPREDNFGIALLSRYPLRRAEILRFGDAGVPSVAVEIMLEGTTVTILGTHPVPPGGAEDSRLRNQQLQALPVILNQWSGPKLLLGDLNTTPWNVHFRRLVRESGLRDSSRGFWPQSSWPAKLGPFGIPLDHCLASPEIVIVDRRLGPRVGSDHLPLIVDFEIQVP